jgi:hypothetical protein
MLLRLNLAVVIAAIASTARAQSPPAVRPLGPVLSRSAEPLGSVAQVRALPGGRVIVHDITGRRVLLFDSTFKNFTVIADSTSGTANAYGSRIGGIIAYHGDSTLFVDPASLSMLVIDANGKIVRTLAAPRPNDVPFLIGGPFGTPGFDSRGRLLYAQPIRSLAAGSPSGRSLPDSALIVRVDLTTRALDTVVKIGIPLIRQSATAREVNGRQIYSFRSIVNPIPWTDDWALLSDGTIAIVRGREYRVDLIDPDGKLHSAPKIAFEWQRLTDEDKSAILDSTRAAYDKIFTDRFEQLKAASRADSAAKSGPARPAPAVPEAPQIQLANVDELPDYRPAFRQGAVHGDADGNLWVRTSKLVNGGPVYDVINKKGELIDRVIIPPNRVIAGFGPGGVVYMGVIDGTITRLERAHVH